MSEPEFIAPYKLALRQEESWWVAYLQLVASADEKTELGRIRMACCLDDPAIKEGFIALMRQTTEASLRAVGVELAHWGGVQPAPEAERSGHG